MLRKLCYALLSLLPLTHAYAEEEAAEEVTSQIQANVPVDNLVHFFYIYDQPQLIVPIVEALAKDKQLANAFPFITTVFQLHPEQFQACLDELKLNAESRKILLCCYYASGHGDEELVALARKDQWPLHEIATLMRPPEVELIDYPLTYNGYPQLMWQAFFASGDTNYLQRIFDLLELNEEELPDLALKETLEQQARDTLKENLVRHELVYRACAYLLDSALGSEENAAFLASLLEECQQLRQTQMPGGEGDFGAIFFVDEEGSFYQKWLEQGGGQPLECKGTKTLVQGKSAQLELLLSGFALDDELHANVTYDLDIYGPNGEIIDSMSDIPALAQKVPSRFFMQRPQRWMTFNVAPDAELGERTFHLRVTDHIANKTIEINNCVEIVAESYE